ncbi:MAG: sulfurtransferase-like selenium metabolism protein YedF [Desulfovibrio sp.]|nr:sulfurtransferase-like selenium metabolism protein YedF [Desulfovibrio sp.]
MNLLDCRGLNCPEPVLRSKKLLTETHPTEIEILVDNLAAKENVSKFWTKNGYTVSVKQEQEGCWRIQAKGSGEVMVESDACEDFTCSTEKTVILITTETLGRGDDMLGTKLMENFLGTLPEIGSLWRIILVNGGVKLTAKEGNCLTNLQKLAQRGVGIMVCGTCLSHYGLLEKKMVGETTNMLDIVSALNLASKVIRP